MKTIPVKSRKHILKKITKKTIALTEINAMEKRRVVMKPRLSNLRLGYISRMSTLLIFK